MQQTMDHRRRILLVAATNVERWKLQVIKLKSIYHVMNMLQLDETNEFQSAECWLPQNDIQFIRQKLNMAAERFNSQNNPIIIVMKHNENPPTFNRTNKFTKGFQVRKTPQTKPHQKQLEKIKKSKKIALKSCNISCFTVSYRCLRCLKLSGNQSDAIYNCHLSISLCHNVWWHWTGPCTHCFCMCHDTSRGKATCEEPKEWHTNDILQRKIHYFTYG